MARSLSVTQERFPIAGTFTISRGSKIDADVVTVRIEEHGLHGWAECVPYGRYGETIESVMDEIAGIAGAVSEGLGRTELLSAMRPGAARNAVD